MICFSNIYLCKSYAENITTEKQVNEIFLFLLLNLMIPDDTLSHDPQIIMSSKTSSCTLINIATIEWMRYLKTLKYIILTNVAVLLIRFIKVEQLIYDSNIALFKVNYYFKV